MKDRIYFHNLNGLRFIAAFMVVVCHIELMKKYFGISNFREEVKQLGVLGVDLFFVLSGFLITYLLLKEKEKFKSINLKSFYLRRVLRIWPLYYFIIILSLFVLPHIAIFNLATIHFPIVAKKDWIVSIALFVMMLPNVLYFLKDIPYAAQTWSIGTEEQFYLVWPLLINKAKKLKNWFIFIIVFYWVFYFLLQYVPFSQHAIFNLFKKYYTVFKVDVLSIGAMAAYVLFAKERIVNTLVNMPVFVFCVLGVFASYFLLPNFFLIERVIYAILFAIIILNLVENKKIINCLEYKWLNYFGQISYGIYMYHQIAIVLVLYFLHTKFQLDNNFMIYSLSLIVTLFISHVSYQYLEKPFLKIKLKYNPFQNEK